MLTTLRKITPSILMLLVAALVLASCGGGGGSGDDGGSAPTKSVSPAPDAPPGEEAAASPIDASVVFVADRRTDGVDELFAATADGTQIARLSPDLNAADVAGFRLSPDRAWVAFDVQTNSIPRQYALYTVDVNGGTALKIADLKEAGAYEWAPDSSRLAVVSPQEMLTIKPDGTGQVRIANPGSNLSWASDGSRLAFRINTTLYTSVPDTADSPVAISSRLPGGSADNFAWSPDSSLIAYVERDPNTDQLDLFTARPDGAGPARVGTQLNAVSPQAGHFYPFFKWSPDSAHLGYVGGTQAQPELFTTPSDALASTQLTGPIRFSTSDAFQWAPAAGSRLCYLQDADGDADHEYVLVNCATDGTDRRQLTPAEVYFGGFIQSMAWSPADAYLAYITAPSSAERQDLTASVAGGGASQTLTQGMAAYHRVWELKWASDESRVAFVLEEAATSRLDLYTAPPGGAGVARISEGLASPLLVPDAFAWTPDDAGIVYIADPDGDGKYELYAAGPDGTGTAKLSGTMVTGGDVIRFAVVK